MSKKIACLSDLSDHGGMIITHNQDGTLIIGGSGRAYGSGSYGRGSYGGSPVAVEGALHSCPIPGHGITPITAVTVKSYQNGKLILTETAVAGCGAQLIPPDRKVNVE